MAPTTSDPLSYTCICPASAAGGSVLLFYRYYQNNPPLPSPFTPKTAAPSDVAAFHENLTTRLSLGGKFRLSTEGFNITIGGTTAAIASYIDACVAHWSFSGLSLSSREQQDAFFKPTPGCACVFGNHASIKVTAEITPLGITNYAPKSWSSVTPLSPASFHEMCLDSAKDVQLVDVRNHYESRIGYFITGAGEIALRPGIRRFSQWPGFVSRHIAEKHKEEGEDGSRKKQFLTYCTGGIRCEKGARYMQEAMAEAHVYTLQGGIVAYLAWMEAEIKAGRKERSECLFKGRNYVFDARGSMGLGLDDEKIDQVAVCHGCGQVEDRLSKCKNTGCHLILVVCEDCEAGGQVSCCEDCAYVELAIKEAAPRGMCQCEKDREGLLWGEAGAKLGKKKRAKKNG